MSPGRLRAVSLRTDRRVDPLGIDDPRPRLSWRLDGPADEPYRGHRVQLAADDAFTEVLWDSGEVLDATLPSIRPEQLRLPSRTRVHWRVQPLSGDRAAVGDWSPAARYEIGLLQPEDWSAQWIGIAADQPGRPIHLGTTLEVPGRVVRARVYASALGWYHLFVDDTDLTAGLIVPAFTPYDREVEYRTVDVTELLTPGRHRLSLVVGDGRFRGALGYHDRRAVYGDRLGGLVQLELELEDGTVIVRGTGTDWTGGHGPIVFSDPKAGETIDLTAAAGRLHEATTPSEVVLLPPHPRRLVAEQADPLRTVEHRPAASIREVGDGRVIVDFGQNLTGLVRLRAAGPAGTRLVLQHAEDLDAAGELEWEHLDPAGAKDKARPRRFQRDELVLDGTPRRVQPWFTVHGFRYVEIRGLTAPLAPEDVDAVVLSSVGAREGDFTSSDPRLEQLYRNAWWSMRGNFLDVPTDCPQRERSGFTGDIQVFAPAATGFADVGAFLGRYLRSLRLEQFDDGRIPTTVPGEYSEHSGGPSKTDLSRAGIVGWADATAILPWVLYRACGDSAIVAEQYDSMRAWVDYLERGGAVKGFIWGEWIRAGENLVVGAMRDNSLNRANIGLAYLAHSARLVGDAARLLDRPEDAERYDRIAAAATVRWRRRAVRRAGARIGMDRQDDYVRALGFGLLPAEQRPAAAARLVDRIRRRHDHLGTGFLSTPMLLPVLVDAGYAEVAYRLLLQTTAPSWLGMVEQGATTILENWTEPGRDGRRRGSSNHYAFGAVTDWLVGAVAGLRRSTPGGSLVVFDPVVGGELSRAAGTLPTEFGPVTASWHRTGAHLTARLEIPIGVEVEAATVMRRLGAGSHEIEWDLDEVQASAGRRR